MPFAFGGASRARLRILLAVGGLLAIAGCRRGREAAPTESGPVTLVTTTSVEDSGLLERLVPAASAAIGRPVRAIAAGSGEALLLAEKGEADVVVAHSPAAEWHSVLTGHLIERTPLMWNRFVLLGPYEDPAKVREAGGDVVEAFRRINETGEPFVSRGDRSGTHMKERQIWSLAQRVDLGPDERSPVARAARYTETGLGQGQTLLIADERGAYVLADAATVSRMRLRVLVPLIDGRSGPSAAMLVNDYHVMRANPERHRAESAGGAAALREWLLGPAAAAVISSSGLFTPRAAAWN